jgi:ABC-type amino acid transport substrate-binding protein/LysM repeat protein
MKNKYKKLAGDNIKTEDSNWKFSGDVVDKFDEHVKKSLLKNMDRLNRFTNSIGMTFIHIPQGYFKMGIDDKSLPKDEQPQHTEVVKSFYIASTEVTQKQWERVMKNNPSYFDTQRLGYNSDENPVENISFNDAISFVNALNRLENRKNSYRLPTEIEWEYIAQDNSSNKLNSNGKTRRVALQKPNRLGLYDVYGNVWEWCSSYYTEDYNTNYQENFRVLRGGSFLNLPSTLRASNRMQNREYVKKINNGLRIVYDKSPNDNDTPITFQYKVKEGDTLPKIAEEFYGDETIGDMLFYHNKKIIGDRPSNLKSGQTINIPPKQRLVFQKTEKKLQDITKNSIKLLAYTDFSPFLSKSLPHGGMANHIVEEIFKVLEDNHYSITWERDADHIPLLKNGQFDVGIAWYAPNCNLKYLSKETKERCRFLDTKPIFKTPSVVYKRESDLRKPLTPKDLYDTRVCRPDEWYTFDLEQKGLIDGENITLVRPNYPKDCFDLLLSNRVDFVAFDKISSDKIIKEMKIENLVESVDDTNISTLINMTLMVYRDNPRAEEIINRLNRGITKLEKSGRLKILQTLYLTNFSNGKGE